MINEAFTEWDGESDLPPAPKPPAATTNPAATSPTTPAVQPPVPQEAVVEEAKETFPTDMRECYSLLAKVEAMPETTSKQARVKHDRKTALQKHIFQLQQGLPVTPVSSHQYGHSVGHHRNNIQRYRWEREARSNTSIRELLKERDEMEKELDAVSDSSGKVESLSKDLETALARLERANEEKAIADGKVLQLTGQVDQLTKDVADAIADRDLTKESLAAANSTKDTAESNIVSLTTERDALKSERDALALQIAELSALKEEVKQTEVAPEPPSPPPQAAKTKGRK